MNLSQCHILLRLNPGSATLEHAFDGLSELPSSHWELALDQVGKHLEPAGRRLLHQCVLERVTDGSAVLHDLLGGHCQNDRVGHHVDEPMPPSIWPRARRHRLHPTLLPLNMRVKLVDAG